MAKIITRKLAIQNGEKYYFTGKPCKNGHIATRLVSTYVCTKCGKEIYQTKDRDNYRYKNTFYRQFCTRKADAIRKGIPFTIEFEDLYQPEYCPVFGKKLNYNWSGINRRDPNKATIDKLNPRLGYIPGNTFVISWRANKLKSNMTLDELKLIMKYMEKNYG